jgi:hypothetical protein
VVGLVLGILLGVVPASANGAVVHSGDGLAMSISQRGAVKAVSVEGRSVESTGSQGGFSMRLVGGTPNLLRNPGFERLESDGTPAHWQIGEGRRPVLDTGTAHDGARSMRIAASHTSTSGPFEQTVRVQPDTSYVLSGWFKSAHVAPTAPPAWTPSDPSPLRLKAQQLSADGKIELASDAFGYTNTAEWNRQFVGFTTLPGVKRVRVVGQIVRGSGTVWYDDLSLRRLLQPVAKHVAGTVRSDSDGLTEETATSPTKQVWLHAYFTSHSRCIRIHGVIGSSARQNTALQLAFTLPVEATGWRFADYVRKSQVIRPGMGYSYLTDWGSQPMSRYPLDTIWSRRAALSIGIPIDEARIMRITYGKAGMAITFDFGLSPRATRLRERASFSFVIYRSAPNWGFRSALQKYYKIFPNLFARRAPSSANGMWIGRADLTRLSPVFGDYRPGIDMLALGDWNSGSPERFGVRYLRWDNSHHVDAMAYNQQWGFKLRQPAGQPNYQEVLSDLRRSATNGDDLELRQEASAALSSTARDYDGRLEYEGYRRYLQFYEDLDPDLPSPTWAGVTQRYQVARALALAASAGGRIDGIHMDSTSGMRRWAAADDYDPSHWASATTPLTFSWDSGKVVERVEFSDVSHLERLADWLHKRGLLLSANFNGSDARPGSWFDANAIDYFGIEQGLPEKVANDPFVTIDSFAMQKRFLAYHRPVSTLDASIGAGSLTIGQLRARLQLNLFYDVFSGIGGHGVWTPRQAGVYGEYTPLFRDLADAGWQPITDARSSNANLWLERYGSASSGRMYIAVRNQTSSRQAGKVQVTLATGRLKGAREVQIDEAITGTHLHSSVNDHGRTLSLQLRLPPKSTRVLTLHITRRGHHHVHDVGSLQGGQTHDRSSWS